MRALLTSRTSRRSSDEEEMTTRAAKGRFRQATVEKWESLAALRGAASAGARIFYDDRRRHRTARIRDQLRRGRMGRAAGDHGGVRGEPQGPHGDQ